MHDARHAVGFVNMLPRACDFTLNFFQCRDAIKQHEIMKERRVIDSNNVYRFVNARTCNRTGIGQLRGSDGQTVVNDKEKANVLNSFFGSVCSVDDGSKPSVSATVTGSTGRSISSVEFNTIAMC